MKVMLLIWLRLSYTVISKPYNYKKVVENGIHRSPYLWVLVHSTGKISNG